jgi:hypothetical protein
MPSFVTATTQLPHHIDNSLRSKRRICSLPSTATVLVKTYVLGLIPLYYMPFTPSASVLQYLTPCVENAILVYFLFTSNLFIFLVSNSLFYMWIIMHQIQCLDVLLEDTDIIKALTEYISYAAITNLVLGASRHGFIR